MSTEGETTPIEIVKSTTRTLANGETITMNTETFDPDKLIGRTYLQDVDENGERFRSKIVQKLIELNATKKHKPHASNSLSPTRATTSQMKL